MTLDQINAVEQIAEANGINIGCLAMLLAIGHGPLTVGIVARMTGYSASGSSRRVRVLEKIKLVVCNRTGTDRREVTLTITPRGLRVVEEVRAV